MSRSIPRDRDPRAVARTASTHARKPHKRRPCGSNVPVAPTGLSLTFDSLAKDGRRRWRAKLKWDEVTLTEAGDATQAERYIVQLEHGRDGASALGDEPRRFVIQARDNDTNTTTTKIVNAGISRRFYYRFRVRAISRDGCRGDWSAWTAWQRPGSEAPPHPRRVWIHENAKDRIVLEWVGPRDPLDPDQYDPDIDHFIAKLTTSPSPGAPPYTQPNGREALHRRITSERTSFRIPLADQDLIFYGWVRSSNSEGDKGPWIPATVRGNSSPGATPDGVSPLRDKVVATFTISGNLEVRHYNALWTADRRYKIKRVRVRCGRHDPATHPADGCPQGAPAIFQLFWHSADESTQDKLFARDDRLTVPANSHKDAAWASDLKRTRIDEDEHLSVKCAQVGSTAPGSDAVIEIILVPD